MLPHTKEPTLLHGCSSAASASEARFRIDRPVTSTRSARIIAVDEAAARFVRELAHEGWDEERFLTFVEAQPRVDEDGPTPDALLEDARGDRRRLSDELRTADAIVMVASRGDAAEGASIVGDICLGQGVMTAGLVVAPEADVDPAVRALRPNAMVLVVLEDRDDVTEILTALRVND
jgi:hypothetical protein